MSEYRFVEKPFLEQLASLGWQIIDHGETCPCDPSASHRSSFREVALKDVFKRTVSAINTLEDGREWLTDRQLEELWDQLIRDQAGKPLLEANQAVLDLLYLARTDVNELTGEEFPDVRLIDFEHPLRNHFLAINQFRIDTPGGLKESIRPDIVLFVNGLPLVVVECKDANIHTANPMEEAVTQLQRYSNQRESTKTAGLREGEERLFHFNQLMIATDGEDAKVGTITSSDEYYFTWKDIWPEAYRTFTPPLGIQRQQETLIQGMLPPETLLDIVRNFILFMEIGKQRVKVVCRYQQYRAACKIIDRLRTGKTSLDRSGVVWHTQGSGKSLTMVFTIRKLRRCQDLKDYKVILVNDRVDLEDQLTKTAALAGEKVTVIERMDQVRPRLSTDSSNLNMVMVHKFGNDGEGDLPLYVAEAMGKYNGRDPLVPQYEDFGVVNDSDRILVMIDEAHRTQSNDPGSISNNLFEAFPNATRVAFTGTPLITERHGSRRTWLRFGGYIDKYRLQDAVDDEVTVQILYEGKTADTALDRKHEFDRKFEDLFRERTDEEILAIKKKYAASGDIFEAEKRIEAIAEDLVDHYIDRILPNGFKAQVVSNSKLAAVHYKTYIDKAIASRLELERNREDRDDHLIRRIEFLQSAVVVSSEGTNERAVITQARNHARQIDAVENFKKAFDYDKPETGIAFLVVCDMLLTGFDAPIEQVMYIDKKVKEHNLLQTIARVNRIAKGKQRGYIVDYIGLSNHLRQALSIYAGDDYDDVQNALKDIQSELPVLDSRYQRLINLFKDGGVKEIEDFVQQRIDDTLKEYQVLESAVEMLKDIKQRATFDVCLTKFLQSMDIVLPHAYAQPYKTPARRFGYILAKTRERYKDHSLNISGAGKKIRRLINEHLISLGIDPKIPPVDLLSPAFVATLDRNKTAKAKASEMEHAIRRHLKVEFDSDPVFYGRLSEKVDALIQKHKEDWEQLLIEFEKVRAEIEAGRNDLIEGVSQTAAPFYDLIGLVAFGKAGIPEQHAEQLKGIAGDIVERLQGTIGIVNFWSNGFEVNSLKGSLSDLLLLSGIPEIEQKSDKIVTEITALAKKRHEELLQKCQSTKTSTIA